MNTSTYNTKRNQAYLKSFYEKRNQVLGFREKQASIVFWSIILIYSIAWLYQ